MHSHVIPSALTHLLWTHLLWNLVTLISRTVVNGNKLLHVLYISSP